MIFAPIKSWESQLFIGAKIIKNGDYHIDKIDPYCWCGDFSLWWLLHRWKGESHSFSSVQKSLKTEITTSRYEVILPSIDSLNVLKVIDVKSWSHISSLITPWVGGVGKTSFSAFNAWKSNRKQRISLSSRLWATARRQFAGCFWNEIRISSQ